MSVFDKYQDAVSLIDPIRYMGKVRRVQGLIIESDGPPVVVGELCQIQSRRSGELVWAEVVGLTRSVVQLMPYADVEGLQIGDDVTATGATLRVPVSDRLLGRVVDAMGRPIDELGDVASSVSYPVIADPPDVLKRKPILEQVATGIRSIDGLVAVGKGQRLGVFSGSGVGKSTLIGMVARNTDADVNVIALIGERGREVREFLEADLGPEGLRRSVVVVSTSNTPPLARLRAAYVATAIAEYFRDRGNDVMLLFDSVTRFARAQREIGLATGEAPATRGYPPSVFSTLPKLLERCGAGEDGTITGFYSILVEGDDLDEPVSDTVRGILDGHLVLSRRLAQRYHYPAVDVLGSVSRLANKVTDQATREAAGYVRRLLAVYGESEDLINVGAYAQGSNPEIDEAIEKMPDINAFLRQAIDEKSDLTETRSAMLDLADMDKEAGDSSSEETRPVAAGVAKGGASSEE